MRPILSGLGAAWLCDLAIDILRFRPAIAAIWAEYEKSQFEPLLFYVGSFVSIVHGTNDIFALQFVDVMLKSQRLRPQVLLSKLCQFQRDLGLRFELYDVGLTSRSQLGTRKRKTNLVVFLSLLFSLISLLFCLLRTRTGKHKTRPPPRECVYICAVELLSDPSLGF